MLRKALAWCREQVGPVPAWVAEARELLDQVRPEPPTLAEVLSQLQAVHDAKHPGDELIRVQLLLERARRAGLL
jgi:hypothetical protein